MSHYQQNIIWLGLILIVLNIIVNIGELKSIIFGSPAGNAPATNPTVTPTPGGGTLAPGPMNPIITSPGQIQPQPQATPPGTSVV